MVLGGQADLGSEPTRAACRVVWPRGLAAWSPPRTERDGSARFSYGEDSTRGPGSCSEALPPGFSVTRGRLASRLTKCRHVAFDESRRILWGRLCPPLLPLFGGDAWTRALAPTTGSPFRKDAARQVPHS